MEIGEANKKLIELELQKQRNVYISNQSRITADYNNELETIKEYNGRQILELLQNADDEYSDEVLIELNTLNHIFKISNRGTNCKPFSIKGIESLMIPNFSPKKSKKLIGNKGLGFRSIINWSNKVVINSQNIDIVFSKEIANNFYNSLNIKSTEDDIKDIAFLCAPRIIEKDQNEWTTQIEIHYKENKTKDIIKQLDTIQNEVLLFVNHINKLTIDIDSSTKTIERIKEDNKVYLNDVLWEVFENNQQDNSSLLPNEFWEKPHVEEHYELKIAIKEKFDTKNNLLYSYFPTEINIDFPFIIHGTFDLDSSRNNLNDSDKNKYVLERLVDLIIDTAKLITLDNVNYKALEFLLHQNENTRLEKLDFYSKIDEKLDKLEIFPCLDNQYRKKDDVVFVSNQFSTFVNAIKMQELFPNMLKSTENTSVNLDNYYINDIDHNNINLLSKKIKNIDSRVKLIYLVYTHFNNEIFELFVDENNDIISYNEETYTPKFSNMEHLVLPDFLKNNIKFLNRELGEKLLNRFDIKDKKSYRVLIDKLYNITNLKEYETATILERIIAEAKKVNTIDTTKEMILSLYENFKIKEINITTKIIPCISKNNEITNSNDLYLSNNYPNGIITEQLFGDIFDSKQFLAEIKIFNFNEQEDKEQIERFFLWLGVNKFTKFSSVKYDINYQSFIFTKIDRPSDFKELSFDLLKIEQLEKIVHYCQKNNNYEKLILWFLIDEKIQEELINKKTLRYFYRTYHALYNAPSYILFQLNNTNIFSDYLITNEKLGLLVNEININHNSLIFKNNDIKKANIENLILKIGAVEKIEDISIKRIRNILKNLEQSSPKGERTSTIYEAVRKHKQILNDNSIKLCAEKNNQLGYYNQDKIYYVNSTKLPKKILDNVPIINVSPRRGNVIKFFGIKDIKNIKIDIENFSLNNNLTSLFKDFYEKIKPYIVIYRFDDLKDKTSKDTALSKLNKADIFLCSSVVYKIGDVKYELEYNDYIESESKYYIKVTNDDFNKIRKMLDFRETFSDIIGSIFNITNIDKFSRLVSDNINETDEIIKRTMGYDSLYEARDYLELSDEFSSFWRIVYKLKNKDYYENYNISHMKNIEKDLNINFDISNINYKNITSDTSCKNIQMVLKHLGIKVEDFNKEDPFYKLDFRKYHSLRLINEFHSNYDVFKNILYKWCQSSQHEKDFLDLIGKYENANKDINENTLVIDYYSIVDNFVTNNFKFTLNSDQTLVKIQDIYNKNTNELNIDDLVSNKEKSLLYFENKLDEAKEIIININTQKTTSKEESKIDISIPSNPQGTSTLDQPPESKENNYTGNSGYGTHNAAIDKEKKEKGNIAEQCAYNWLVNEYGQSKVKWFSKESDSGHYDIRYETTSNNWIYVEVKTYSSQMFHLPKEEKIFAEKNIGQYEIFFVELPSSKKCEDSKVYIIKNVDFSNENIFRLEPSKYEVYYKLKVQQNLGTNKLPNGNL